jgi:transporter family-2 protein
VTGVAVALAVAAGLAGAVQAAVMGELGGRAGIFPALAFSGVVAVVIGLALLLIAKQSFRGLGDVARQPVWLWTGGALSVLIILAITVASPRIGLAATIGIIIAFNLCMAALIDRWLVRLRSNRDHVDACARPGAAGRRRSALALQEQLTFPRRPTTSTSRCQTP